MVVMTEDRLFRATVMQRGAAVSRAISPPTASRSKSSAPAVPLSDLQPRLLWLLAAHRTPESNVAGAIPLARGALVGDDLVPHGT
jgi:hypothetical protein